MNSLLKGSSMAKPKLLNAPTLNDIRHAMLDILGDNGAQTYPIVQLRVTYAEDVQDLWYLRGDVMAAVAALNGEVSARQQLADISAMFKGLLPSGLSARPSPLGH
ncbi:hypothetical protein [Rhodoferax sp.]|uniref:hypothetical protein n=1 Tax=Rhodoferax sp. TaxID=50421 RepID=UPI0025F68374|nr:hypothetical protein [Rhodoferax sp.]